MKVAMLLWAAIGLTSPALAGDKGDDPDVCHQVVLIGRVTDSAWLGSIDDFNGHWKLDIRVRQVLRGTESRHRITAAAAAEAEIRRDRDFVFFLKRSPSGAYGVESADLDLGRGRAQLYRCT